MAVTVRSLLALAATLLACACATPLGGSPMGAALPSHPALLPPSGTIHDGADAVRVLRSGESTFTELRLLIDGARQSVDVEVYEFGRTDLAAAVVAAHRRGVAVTVIDDRSESQTAGTVAGLRAQGVDVVDYPIRARMIDHVKLLLVDARVAVVGGINWGVASSANHDFDVELHGPVVANLQRVFARDLVTCGRLQPVPPVTPDAAVLVATTLPGSEVLPLVLGVLDSSRRTLDVAMYTLTDADAVAAIEAAHDRGVAVRVLLDPSERPSDPSAASLRAHGVPVRLYRSSGELLHAKVAIADGSSVVLGSANWTFSGFEHNHELDVALPGAPAIAAAFVAQFDSDWSASA